MKQAEPFLVARVFSWPAVIIALILTLVTGLGANGPQTGTAHLKNLVPGVTIPDLTPNYSPTDLPGFFQAMGDKGRQAYLLINAFDFLLIISYSLLAVLAIGTMLRYLMNNKVRATRLALLGLIPGLCDAIESSCLHVIVMNPTEPHTVLSQVAALATKLKFMTIDVALATILLLAGITLITWLKRR